MSTRRASGSRLPRRLTGVAFLVVLALLAWLSLALYQKRFTPVVLVTLHTGSVGNEMSLGAEVKVRGVQVGEVRQIASDGAGARLLLALAPDAARSLPANVSAELLPTTLFGERYVDLVLPATPVAARLADDPVISQSRSRDAIELQQVFDDLLPTLRAVQPDQLAIVLTAIAQGLHGRGRELGQTLVEIGQVLGKVDPQLPALDADLTELAGFASTYTQAAPGILTALDELTVTSRTLVDERAQLADLYPTVTTASADLTAFLRSSSSNLIRLSADSTGVLAALARYSPEYPCTLADLVKFEPVIDKVLGKGTRQPGLHVIAHVISSRGRYLPGVDTPRFTRNTGPRCVALAFGAAAGAVSRAGPRPGPGPGLGPGTGAGLRGGPLITPAAMIAGLPGDGELIRELSALALGQPPAALPGWSSLLVGPLFRGQKVTLR